MRGEPTSCKAACSPMIYRRLGRTNLNVSVIGFGTTQLRMVPTEQALATLEAGFRLGVNIVHTSADYGDALQLVGAAVKNTSQPITVCSNGWGSTDYFEFLFEQSRELFGTALPTGEKQLGMFGIACPEDRELLGEDVWS